MPCGLRGTNSPSVAGSPEAPAFSQIFRTGKSEVSTGQTQHRCVSRYGRARPLAHPSGVAPVIMGTDVPGLRAPKTDTRGVSPEHWPLLPEPAGGLQDAASAQDGTEGPQAEGRGECPGGLPRVTSRECRPSREGLRVSPAFHVPRICTHTHTLPGSAAFRGQAEVGPSLCWPCEGTAEGQERASQRRGSPLKGRLAALCEGRGLGAGRLQHSVIKSRHPEI